MIKISDNFIILETKNTSLIFEIKDYFDFATPFNKNKKYITQFYYGYKDDCKELVPTKCVLPGRGSNNDYNVDKLISSTYGNGNNKETILLVENSDNTYINRFFFSHASVIKGSKDINGPKTRNVKETLEIVELDDVSNIELHHYYSLLDDSDVIISKKEIINHGNKDIKILRLFSLEIPIDGNSFDVHTFDGAWLFEKTRHTSTITNGVFQIDSKIGSSSNRHNPYIEIIDKNREDVIYGINFIYSGNHKEQLEVNHLQYSTLMVGINDFGFSIPLKKDQSFITPEAIFVVCKNQDELTKTMHYFVINHIINPQFINSPRPVLFNNWEGTGMKIDEKSLLDMAIIAKSVGVEQFVVDDGWFKNRITDLGGLGDWEVDLDKFPQGLEPFVAKIRTLGLKFGIWIEPEMICINSDLYKKYPNYACIIPSREPIERRHQLMIDMANSEVVDHLYNSLIKVFDKIKPDYIKWDYNRFHSDIYSSSGILPGEYLYRFIYGTYDLLEKLTSRYPNTIFEGCASGGARFDLGMLYYTPQIWGSDDTNTYFRTFISCGTFMGYPQSTLGAHVSRDYCPDEKKKAISSLEDRFNLNCFGAFGYEFDFRTIVKEDLKIIAKQIEFYKKHKKLLQYGQLYIDKNCFDDKRYFSINVVSEDKKESILLVEQIGMDVDNVRWTLKGLDRNKRYLVSERKQSNVLSTFETELSGEELMDVGLALETLSHTTNKESYPNGVFTRLFYLKEVD